MPHWAIELIWERNFRVRIPATPSRPDQDRTRASRTAPGPSDHRPVKKTDGFTRQPLAAAATRVSLPLERGPDSEQKTGFCALRGAAGAAPRYRS